MSAIGPKRTSLIALHMSAFGGKADMTFCGANIRFWHKADIYDTSQELDLCPTGFGCLALNNSPQSIERPAVCDTAASDSRNQCHFYGSAEP
jgi:hypothetical protein